MKIRCGSHQQNRSIVRPGLSLMATKVALTAEEFRENSQRSIALFNTEKLSTDSTHVLKSAYCILCISAVAICTGRVEAKAPTLRTRTILKVVPICTGRVEAKRSHTHCFSPFGVPICTGRVEAKAVCVHQRQRAERCNLHGACGGKGRTVDATRWRIAVAICTGRAEKPNVIIPPPKKIRENLCRPIAFLFILLYNPSCPADGHKNDENQDEDKGVDCYGEDARIAGLFRWSGYLDYRAVAEGKL